MNNAVAGLSGAMSVISLRISGPCDAEGLGRHAFELQCSDDHFSIERLEDQTCSDAWINQLGYTRETVGQDEQVHGTGRRVSRKFHLKKEIF
jgi:hypothetical protein